MPPGYTFCGLRRTTLPGTSVNIDQRYHGSKHEVKGTSARWLLLAVNFGELPYGEVRRILLLGTGVKIALAAAPFHGFGVARQGPWITWVNKSAGRTRSRQGPQYLRQPLLGDLFLFRTHHHNRAVGVLDDAARDAPHERPPYPALASAAHNYQASAQLLGQGDDLVVRSSHLEVSLSDLSPRLLNTLHLSI